MCNGAGAFHGVRSHTIEAIDWGLFLHLKNPAPQQATYIGCRAHEFVPIWGERPRNALPVQVADQADLPFEANYYLLPQNPQMSSERICWFVQRVQMPETQKKGMPDYLGFQEEKNLANWLIRYILQVNIAIRSCALCMPGKGWRISHCWSRLWGLRGSGK